MRFQQKRLSSSVPEVNLVPMMDVLMSVLIFFIITATVFTGQKLVNVELPETKKGIQQDRQDKQEKIAPLVIGLNREGKIILAEQTIEEADLVEKMQSYLSQNPAGTIVVKADRKLPYQKVTKLLKKMGKIGGDRVLLALQKK